MKNNTKREHWIDALKIFACFLVVILHTITYGLQENKRNFGIVLYYLGTIAIPIFFMVNGYLQLRRKVNYKYVINKVFNGILNFIVFLFKIIVNGKVENLFEQVYKCFLQKGYFYQFWFLGSLILIYLVLPILSRIFNTEGNLYKKITVILIIESILINVIGIRCYLRYNLVIKDNIIQTFRIWTWLMYFCLGGYINKNDILQKISKKIHICAIVFCTGLSLVYQYLVSNAFYGNLYAENFYDSVLIIINSILVFTYFRKVNYEDSKLVTMISNLTMGVYIVHPLLKNVIKKVFSQVIQINNLSNVVILLFVYLGSLIISYVIYKIPKLNKIIKI